MRDDEFFQALRKLNRSLKPEQRAALLAVLNDPAGDVELTDEDLGSVAGGLSTEHWFTFGCCPTNVDPCQPE